MPFNLFGFKFRSRNDDLPSPPSFAPPLNEDGALVVEQGGAYGTFLDLDGSVKTEMELIGKYREMSLQAEIDQAISEIVNQAIVCEEHKSSISLVLDKLNYSQELKNKIRDEFENVLNLLDFNSEGQDIFKRWYVDGRLFFHILIDPENPRDGIQELRPVDPRHIKLVREMVRDVTLDNVQVVEVANEYYIYNDLGNDGVSSSTAAIGVKVSKDSICYIHSGIQQFNNTTILSHLHKAVKPINMLRMVEDATVIYRLSRAPERRVFYIDVGSLPKNKAEQYLKDIMAKYRNKMVYDATTGEVREDKKFLSFMEDYWLPRREGGRGTEITTLPGGENLGEMADVEYFKQKLYECLNVPMNRLKADVGLGGLGRASEITRDELKFDKFIFRLRNRFSQLFDRLLSTQLILKGIIAKEDWTVIRQKIFYDYLKDTYYSELKNIEIMRERFNLVRDVQDYVNKYISNEWVRRTILQQTDEEIALLDSQIAREKNTEKYPDPNSLGMDGIDGMGGDMGGLDGDVSGMGAPSGEGPEPPQIPPPEPEMVALPDNDVPEKDHEYVVDPSVIDDESEEGFDADLDDEEPLNPEDLPLVKIKRNVEGLWKS